jgi:hypothetical protein
LLPESILQEAEVQLEVVDRKSLFEEGGRLRAIWESCRHNPQEAVRLKNLFERELFREANCERVLMIEDMSIPMLVKLMAKAGINPMVFLSDNRGEQARIAIDLEPVDGKHPLANKIAGDVDMNKEMRYFEKVFPLLRWRMSRNHSTVYLVHEVDKPILILPVHVDPKNAVVVFKDLLGRKDKSEKGAMEYHGMEETKGQDYLGTGLYDLGIALLIGTFQRLHQKGLFRDLKINGENLIDTTGTIIGDDEQTWLLADLFKAQQGQVVQLEHDS